MTGAQAADLPVKAKPVQYVKICSLYGAGFYYIPGTDTCIKLGGWVRAEMNFNGGGSFSVFKSATLDSRALDFETTRTRGIMTIDARSQTEYGTLRSYIAGGFQETNNAWTSNETYAPRAFVQWAGFTAGRAQSFFDFYATPAYSNTTNVLGSDTGGQGDTVFAYTAQFGNGFSASISAEDTTARRLTVSGSGGYAGRQWPDFAANLRLDQAWGSAQVMGAVHQVRTKSDTSPTFSEVGYALGAGVKFNLPMLGKGDSFATQFTYAKGALSYVGSGLGTFAITNGGTTANGLSDDAVVSGTAIDLTQGWSVVAGYGHHWNANWQTSLYGTYGHINYSDAAGATLWGAGQNADWSFWQVGSRTVWTPVHNLDLSVDVMYNKLDQSLTGAAFDDKGWWQGMFRVQRNFYP
jgi:hypothetical protein